MDSLRKRVPFKVETEEDIEEDSRVLDEQEQEEWLAELREKAAVLDRRIHRQALIYTAISCLLHAVFFFRLDLLNDSPIVAARLFALLLVLVHINLVILLTPTFDTPFHRLIKKTAFLPLPIPWALGIAVSAPLTSLASGKNWKQSGWWSITTIIVSLVWIMLRSLDENREGLENLEKLKYNAKGA